MLGSSCASGQKRQSTAILLASVVVLKFEHSLWVQLTIGVRKVYFRGFEPREGCEPTESMNGGLGT